jgi:hypothetical protein
MKRRSLAATLALALAACSRAGPPAPVVSCATLEQPIVIDGRPQRALATRCLDDEGRAALRPERYDPRWPREPGPPLARDGAITAQQR